MEVQKLFYEDSTLTEFTAQVTGCTQAKEGWLVTLDRTAFYPEGGGQAWDTGTLDQAQVLAVREQDTNIVHLCDRELTPGSTVTGKIHWDRRFDLMQQHTGEHILSGIICRRYGYHNVGFHVGEQVMEIDFDGPVPQEDLAAIELEANRAIWEDLPIRCWYPSREELPQIPYRTKKALQWPVRIVEVPGYDLCACCGTHLPRTGQIGLIKILSCVKFHQGVRMELVCGKRAYTTLCAIFDQNRVVSQTFSAKPMETGQAARKINDQLNAEKLRASNLEKRLFDAIAENYVNQHCALYFADGLTSAGVRELADRLAQQVTGWAAVFSGTDQDGYSMCLVSRTQDVKALGSQAVCVLNGRGGGKPNCFQGSVKASKAQINGFFQKQEVN